MCVCVSPVIDWPPIQHPASRPPSAPATPKVKRVQDGWMDFVTAKTVHGRSIASLCRQNKTSNQRLDKYLEDLKSCRMFFFLKQHNSCTHNTVFMVKEIKLKTQCHGWLLTPI